MKHMSKKQALACAVICLGIAPGAQAMDLPPLLAAQKETNPTQLAALLRAARTGAQETRGVAGNLDTTPPVLKSFKVTPPKDVAGPAAQIRIDAKATDDLSGVIAAQFTLVGPHGQSVTTPSGSMPAPEKVSTSHLALDATAYLEPGTWRVAVASVTDAAFNWVQVTGDALAALGDVEFEVVNKRPEYVDFTPATFTQGVVVTPSVSASGTLKGTTQPPMVMADFAMTDDRSGVDWASAYWCLADMSSCIRTDAREWVHGRIATTVRTAGMIYGARPGVYLLESVSAMDYAGNYVFLWGTDFGGYADFSALMPGGHGITITP